MTRILRFPRFTGLTAMLLLSMPFAAACGPSSGEGSGGGGSDSGRAMAPRVVSNTPLTDATEVATNGYVSATFNDKMDPAKLTEMTFTLTSGAAAIPVAGTVTY